MATQIAATPIIKGEDALAILKEANSKPSYDTSEISKKLSEKFEKLMNGNKKK